MTVFNIFDESDSKMVNYLDPKSLKNKLERLFPEYTVVDKQLDRVRHGMFKSQNPSLSPAAFHNLLRKDKRKKQRQKVQKFSFWCKTRQKIVKN